MRVEVDEARVVVEPKVLVPDPGVGVVAPFSCDASTASSDHDDRCKTASMHACEYRQIVMLYLWPWQPQAQEHPGVHIIGTPNVAENAVEGQDEAE